MKNTNPETKKCAFNSLSIDYLYYQGGKKSIIFLHATGFIPWLWHPIARELLDDFTVYVPYFCDHRSAEPEDGGLHWEILAEDLCMFCEKKGLTNPYLVGHSMGATVMTLAHTIYNSPVEKMVLIEPIFLPEQIYDTKLTVEQHPLAAMSIKRKNYWKNETDARNYLKSKNLFAGWNEEMIELYIDHGMITVEGGGLQLACHPRKEASLFMGSNHCNPWPLLEKIKSPTLVIEGEQSENRAFIDLKKTASMIPEGEYLSVEGTGHLVPMEKPSETTDVIKDFFIP